MLIFTFWTVLQVMQLVVGYMCQVWRKTLLIKIQLLGLPWSNFMLTALHKQKWKYFQEMYSYTCVLPELMLYI